MEIYTEKNELVTLSSPFSNSFKRKNLTSQQFAYFMCSAQMISEGKNQVFLNKYLFN